MSLLANSNAIESGGYNIDRSLRFRSSASAYLSRTPASAGNRKIWTWSGWVKKSKAVSAMGFLSAGTNGNQIFFAGFGGTDDKIYIHNGVQGSSTASWAVTSAVFRDPSAWYHIVLTVDTTQATDTNRIKLYVNNQLQTLSSFSGASTYPTQNYDTAFNNNVIQEICYGYDNGSKSYFDGYLAEVNFIDGQALTPSSFGQTDAVTGVWQPKKYTGTYGTNGFYLPFSDNTSATTLAYDKSGNGNNWTPNNISTTAGATYDSMTDVPTLTSATAANFCTWNPLNYATGFGMTDGNLNANIPNVRGVSSTIGMSSGKWYAETTLSQTGILGITLATYSNSSGGTSVPFDVTGGYGYITTGSKRNAGTDTAYGASYTSTDIIGIAFDADAGTLTFYKNGTSQGTAFTGIPANTYVFAAYGASGTTNPTNAVLNCGQRPFSYTPPTGFKALNTFNLPDPTIKQPNQYMDATLYTGDATNNRQITNAGSMQPDLVWIKDRTGTAVGGAAWHMLYDSSRGGSNGLSSNSTAAEPSNAFNTLASFNSNGFTIGTGGNYINASGEPNVAWQWKKGATPGFDIVTFTSPASGNFTVNHSLGVTPAMVIVKTRDTAGWNWHVWHKSLASATNSVLVLNSTAAVNSSFNMWGASGATSTTIGITTGNPVPANSACVAYLFAEIAGFSKFGSYTGNGSADGPFVYCGFRPKYVMIKRSDSTSNWAMFDTSRLPYNTSAQAGLYANTSDAEVNAQFGMNIMSSGFKLSIFDAFINTNSGTYIYAAFAENPFKYSLAR